MFKNYFTIALRNLKRQKLYAFINIFGLALGIACCLLIALLVKQEWSHDRFHENKNRLFRLTTHELMPNGKTHRSVLFTYALVDALKEDIPGITHATTFLRSNARITLEDQVFKEQIGLVSPDFLTMFTFPLLAGNPTTALNNPDGIVLSTQVAHKFFGEPDAQYSNVLGQSLTFPGQNLTFVVTGIIEDVPMESSLRFDVLIPITHWEGFGRNQENKSYASLYVLLAKGHTVSTIETALQPFARHHLSKRIEDLAKWHDIQDSENAFKLALQPLTDVYWNADFSTPYERRGNLTAVYILWGIASLVLLLACSNFTTLSIARSTDRAMEVGVRKMLGADRRQVMQQFWSESLLFSFFALLLGVALTEMFLPVFNELIQSNLQISYFNDGSFWIMLLIIMTLVGIVSGSYPSLVLSRFQPVSAIKGESRLGGRSGLTRTLVVLQYAASIALIGCTGVMIEQQNYMREKSLGYDQEHVVVVHSEDEKVAERYKQKVLQEPSVLGATITDRAFTTGSASAGYKLPDGTTFSVRVISIDPDFLPTLKIDLIDGRNFSNERPSDAKNAVIINETMAKRLGQDNPIGQTISGMGWGDLKNTTVIGIVRDFHIDSMHRRIRPLVLQMMYFNSNAKILVRLHPGNIAETVTKLKETWKTVAPPDEKIRLSFLDTNLEKQYQSEQRWQSIFSYASIFTIAISCLGLLGLASLAVSRRTKEIGIRKILGASIPNLLTLLSKDFMLLLVLSNLIAWPLAYYTMEKWLTNFAYHIELSIGIFIFSGLLALIVALFTVCTQTLKAARSNPVDALRYE